MWLLVAAWGGAVGALAVAALLAFLGRRILDRMIDRILVRLLKEPYPENLWDLMLGFTRVPPHALLELELRADTGKTLNRPLGSVVRVPTLTGITFNPAQLIRPPLGPDEPVDLTVTLGPRARVPLRLDIPMMVAAMAYGTAMSKPFVLALARGAAMAGTAFNMGTGPVPEEVWEAGERLIAQYTGLRWTRRPEVLRRADMVEIRLGHGGRAALGRIIPADRLPPEARELLGVSRRGAVRVDAPVPGAENPQALRRLVARLRELTGGRPVAVKLAATHDLERELDALLEAGVDVIAIDGSEGGTHGSPPVICDDFGLPSAHALHRAARYLERTGARREVSLVASGGLRTPGEMLKMIALGADAVYVGTAAMMATTHGQLSKVAPFEPITQMVWATGAKAHRFDPAEGARTLANFLLSCAGEMAEAARALGRRSIRQISREDLVARDPDAAAIFNLPPSWLPPRRGRTFRRARPGEAEESSVGQPG